ncbi:MAG: hypothetical protein LUE93_12470, partial [Bacteroides sp.]|nr:hypothetical protein [Bacteroides sp.]
MKIIYPKAVNLYLKELIKILYQKEYFGYHESARDYVLSLRREVEATIHIRQKRKAPSYFSRYGKDLWYVSYPRSKQTTWYFFFTHHAEDVYVIRYITNNHVEGH